MVTMEMKVFLTFVIIAPQNSVAEHRFKCWITGILVWNNYCFCVRMTTDGSLKMFYRQECQDLRRDPKVLF